MMDQFSGTPEGDVSLDDRRWALLAYLFTPIVPLMILLLPDVRARSFIKAHLSQALALGVVQTALLILAPFTFCLSTVAFLLLYVAIFYWGFKAYNGEYVTIPLVTEYVQKQGWL
jgi:uncharacterized membrane protein